MKKIIISAAILLTSFAINANAQDSPLDSRENLHFGFKAGINSSNVYDVQGQDFTAHSIIGFAGGAFLSVPLGKYLGIQPEVLFSQKGYQSSGEVLGNDYTMTRTLNFIDVPLLVAFKPSPFLTILGGPEYSFLTSTKDVYQSSEITSVQQQQMSNNNLRKNILGVVVGADVNIKQLVISGRAGWDLQNNNGDGSSTNVRYSNVWLELTLGIRI